MTKPVFKIVRFASNPSIKEFDAYYIDCHPDPYQNPLLMSESDDDLPEFYITTPHISTLKGNTINSTDYTTSLVTPIIRYQSTRYVVNDDDIRYMYSGVPSRARLNMRYSPMFVYHRNTPSHKLDNNFNLKESIIKTKTFFTKMINTIGKTVISFCAVD